MYKSMWTRGAHVDLLWSYCGPTVELGESKFSKEWPKLPFYSKSRIGVDIGGYWIVEGWSKDPRRMTGAGYKTVPNPAI